MVEGCGHMNNKFFSDKFLNKSLKVLGVILLFLAVLFMLSMFSDFISTIWNAVSTTIVPFAIAWLISLVLYPVGQVFERRGIPRWLNVTIVYLIAIIIIYFAFTLLGPLLVTQIEDFFEIRYPELVTYFNQDFRDDFIFGGDIYDQILAFLNETNLIENTLNTFLNNSANNIGSSMSFIFTIVLILPILLLFYLLDYEVINDSLRSIIPNKYEKDAADLGNRLNQTVGAYIRGQLILMFSIGLVATLLYWVFGLSYWFVFGLIVGLTNIIPYFGAIIALVPVLVYAIITKEVSPFLVLGINVILQMIEGNIFQPLIMGKQLEMHPLIIIGSILFFGSLFGTLGVVFAAPLAAGIRVIYIFVREKMKEHRERQLSNP
jgi:putative permease